MSLIDLSALASTLPDSWHSTKLGQVGSAHIKVLRMDATPTPEEIHGYNEALIVIDGQLLLQFDQETVIVAAGQLYLVPAGAAHRVREGSFGTLVIVDL